MNKQVFVDTSAWIMLINKSEQYHHEAVNIYSMLQQVKLVTSSYVLSETYTWLRKRNNFKSAFSFLQSIWRKVELNQLDLIYTDAALEKQAGQLLEKYAEHEISYADAVSFAIMKKIGIKAAFAYDKHFSIAGFGLVDQTSI